MVVVFVFLSLITDDIRLFPLESRMKVLRVCLTQHNCKPRSRPLVWTWAAEPHRAGRAILSGYLRWDRTQKLPTRRVTHSQPCRARGPFVCLGALEMWYRTAHFQATGVDASRCNFGFKNQLLWKGGNIKHAQIFPPKKTFYFGRGFFRWVEKEKKKKVFVSLFQSCCGSLFTV